MLDIPSFRSLKDYHLGIFSFFFSLETGICCLSALDILTPFGLVCDLTIFLSFTDSLSFGVRFLSEIVNFTDF